MQFERLAPAKVNLFLHVGPLGNDGYHPLSSLMAFADVGDVVHLTAADTMSFSVKGPFGESLGDDGGANLIVRARDAVMEAFPGPWPPFLLTLDKQLPIAAGLGGGSSDAAATINLLRQVFELGGGDWPVGKSRFASDIAFGEDEDDYSVEIVLANIAGALGADVTACLASKPVIAKGRGDVCDFPPVFDDLDVVLVNPRLQVSTGAVYAAFDAFDLERSAEPPPMPEAMQSSQEVAAFLAVCRNDLEAPAISLQPAIGVVLAALRERPETLFARMSGSGATCFAICADKHARRDLAFSLAAQHPGWWVQPCRLGGFRP